jgi:putative PIN family toxin of toxin-antitoxin system
LTAKQSRIVLDTNVLVSAVLREGSVAAAAVKRAFALDIVLFSREAILELADVLQRAKFSRNRTLLERQQFLMEFAMAFEPIEVLHTVMDCRDAGDNMFLELALSARADIIVRGDADLLCLHPWRGIAILSPADYLAQAR